jgi:hypothetical protein
LESFTPDSPRDWDRVNINLTPYVGNDQIRIGFIGINGNGNILYLDSIEVAPTQLNAIDLGIQSLDNLPVVSCIGTLRPDVQVRNYGFETIDFYTINYTINGLRTSITRSNVNLASGQVDNFTIPIRNLQPGVYNMEFSVEDPNSFQDQEEANNEISYQAIIDESFESLPDRLDFDEESKWIITNPIQDPIWTIQEGQLIAPAFDQPQLGINHWFISPIYQTDGLENLSLLYDYAYQSKPDATDRLRILLSTNCGEDYPYTLLDKTSMELSDLTTNEAFIPSPDDWQEEFIDISSFLQWPEIRLAFLFTNGNGNNLYIDNIEFLNTNETDVPRSDEPLLVYPNPAVDGAFTVKLNLEQKENIELSLHSISGNTVFKQSIENGLNQLIKVSVPAQNGIYFLTLTGSGTKHVSRVVLSR